MTTKNQKESAMKCSKCGSGKWEQLSMPKRICEKCRGRRN